MTDESVKQAREAVDAEQRNEARRISQALSLARRAGAEGEGIEIIAAAILIDQRLGELTDVLNEHLDGIDHHLAVLDDLVEAHTETVKKIRR